MANFTKQAISASFLKLLNEKRFDKITVKDIVTDCGVSRKTFYYYFEDIFDLLEKCLADLTQASIRRIDNVQSFEAELRRLLEFVMQNKRAVYHIYYSVSRDQLEEYLYGITLPVVQAVLRDRLRGTVFRPEELDIFSTVLTNAFTGTVLRWIKEGMPDTTIDDTIRLTAQALEDALQAAVERHRS